MFNLCCTHTRDDDFSSSQSRELIVYIYKYYYMVPSTVIPRLHVVIYHGFFIVQLLYAYVYAALGRCKNVRK